MPKMLDAWAFTSSMERASLTPPPLPRPPAWICAFTTHTGPPSDFAAATASSTDMQATPRGTATPYCLRISLPWYSWIFIGCHPRRARLDRRDDGVLTRCFAPDHWHKLAPPR